MLIDLSTPEDNQAIIEANDNNDATYLDYLSTTQQDDLLRKYILQEGTLIPEARCSKCSNKSFRSCLIMQSYKSYAAYQAYNRMYDDMQLVKLTGSLKSIVLLITGRQ